jgi:hypothetical protein
MPNPPDRTRLPIRRAQPGSNNVRLTLNPLGHAGDTQSYDE